MTAFPHTFRSGSSPTSPLPTAFVRDRCVLDSNAEVEIGTFYGDWRTWCEKCGAPGRHSDATGEAQWLNVAVP